MKKRALILGVTGMDGSLLAQLLLQDGYEVHGLIRRASTFPTERIDHLRGLLHLHYGDLSDGSALGRILELSMPDEIYHLAAQSHVRVSFDLPEYTVDVGATGTLRLFEAVRQLGLTTKIYNACSSEMFGSSPAPQRESTPFRPRSPYGVAKVAAHHLGVHYREAYEMWIANGILFNHTYYTQSEAFIVRKITRGIAKIVTGQQKTIALGNLEAQRDVGWGVDYVNAMRMMLAREEPDDFVIGTGVTYPIHAILGKAFAVVGLAKDWKQYITIDERFYRPTEVDVLKADAYKARAVLGWEPTLDIDQIITTMVKHDVEREQVAQPFTAKLSPTIPRPATMDGPDGPACWCGKPSTMENGWCGQCGDV